MVALSARLERHLARDWRDDLTPAWREFFEGVEPDTDRLPDWEVPEVAPPRLNLEHPREAGDPVPLHHMARAFDGLTPERVKVVILGQDPYPKPNRPTGRAFEDGTWDAANPQAVADSLRRLLQSAAAHERPDLGVSEERDDWARVCHAIQAEEIVPPATPTFFDALAAQGVLSVNAAWTFTGRANEQKGVHLRVWKPVVNHLLRDLAKSDQPVVFLLLGEEARKAFCAADPVCNRTAIVDNAHPRSRQFFERRNPLARVNEALGKLGVPDPITWWPPAEPRA